MNKLSETELFKDKLEMLGSLEQIQKEQEQDQGDEARPIFIPGFIVANTTIPSGAKMVYGRVVGLSKKRGFCWASNEEIGNPINYKRESVKNYLAMLYKIGCLHYIVVRDEQTKQVIERRIYPTLGYNNTPPLGDNNTPPGVSKHPKSISDSNVIINVNNEDEQKSDYYAGLLAGILGDDGSISFYQHICRQHDPNELIRKAKEITKDGGARNPAAVFTAWLKEQPKK